MPGRLHPVARMGGQDGEDAPAGEMPRLRPADAEEYILKLAEPVVKYVRVGNEPTP